MSVSAILKMTAVSKEFNQCLTERKIIPSVKSQGLPFCRFSVKVYFGFPGACMSCSKTSAKLNKEVDTY